MVVPGVGLSRGDAPSFWVCGPRMLPEVLQWAGHNTHLPSQAPPNHTHTQSGPIQSVSSIRSRKP